MNDDSAHSNRFVSPHVSLVPLKVETGVQTSLHVLEVKNSEMSEYLDFLNFAQENAQQMLILRTMNAELHIAAHMKQCYMVLYQSLGTQPRRQIFFTGEIFCAEVLSRTKGFEELQSFGGSNTDNHRAHSFYNTELQLEIGVLAFKVLSCMQCAFQGCDVTPRRGTRKSALCVRSMIMCGLTSKR